MSQSFGRASLESCRSGHRGRVMLIEAYRRVIPRNTKFDPSDKDAKMANEDRADTEGQISIHLPHNSLLVMHAEMQEVRAHSTCTYLKAH